MKTVIVIPARYGSTRFPGKPLAAIAGQSMLSRVWKIANKVPALDRVLIATDDKRIQEHAQQFGAEVVMTDPTCKNGSERAFQALNLCGLKPDLVINFQGDAVLTPPNFIQSLIEGMRAHSGASIGTLACAVPLEQAKSSTLVVFDKNSRALYFSRALIPNMREKQDATKQVFHKHIGIYAFRFEALQKYVQLEPTRLESLEKLEQLRALENGMPIQVFLVEPGVRSLASVDSPQDVEKVEAIIKREGELI